MWTVLGDEGGGGGEKQRINFNRKIYSHEEDLLVEDDGPRITPYLSHCGKVVILAML